MGEPSCRAVRPLLSAWLDDELPEAASTTVARHCEACEHCRLETQRLATVRSLLRSLPERRHPEGVPGHAARRVSVRRRRLARAGATAAVTLGLLAGAAFSLGGLPPPDTHTVQVPLDAYVADHVVRNGPALAPGSP